MKQVLIRNVDEALVELYRNAARENGRSLEAELRAALERARPVHAARRNHAEAVRAMLPDCVPGPSGVDIIRAYRDSNGIRDRDRP